MWKVYDKTGTKVRCEVRKVQYSGTFMGECFVNTTLHSELPIEFEIGDYFIYRNEQFTINYDPSVLKKAGARKSGEAYVYDGVKFNSFSDELTRCDFLDYVLEDNFLHFSALPTFSFFASSIKDLADRIQANLDRIYTSDQKWIVEVHSEYVNTTNVNIDVSKIKVWGALEFIKSKFNANFIIRGRKIIIGTAGVAIDNVFQYGKGNGLVEIQRVADSNQQIVTRLRVYGSERNIPVRYYNLPKIVDVKISSSGWGVDYGYWIQFNVAYSEERFSHNTEFTCSGRNIKGSWKHHNQYGEILEIEHEDYLFINNGKHKAVTKFISGAKLAAFPPENVFIPNLPNNMAVRNLMLPDFPKLTNDPYLDSENISSLGIREGSVFFDGSTEGLEEIHPSMEGMTAQQLIDAGISCDVDSGDNGNLDEIFTDATDKDGKIISDDGKWDELKDGANIPPFNLTLKDIGFDINDYLTGEKASISMKDGMCGGREFEITKCLKKGNKYVITCNRIYDDGLKLYFPYKDYNIKAGDKFVLLNIDMPEVYISAASQRLLKAGKECLAKNDYVRYTYEVKIDEIYMARHPKLYSILKEGDLMLFTEPDFHIDGSIIIDSLRITEGEGIIPTFEVTLADEKQVGTIDKIQNVIDSVVNGQGSGGYNSQQINSLIKSFGKKIFLSKVEKDTAAEVIGFEKGVEFGNYTPGSLGSGGVIKVLPNGQTYVEVDKIYVRMKAMFDSLTIKELQHVGGEILLTLAGIECTKVETFTEEALCDANGNHLYDSLGRALYVQKPTGGIYRCYFTADDGEKAVLNQFVVGDMAQCKMFNIEEGVYNNVKNKYYWRLVLAVGPDYIDLAMGDCDKGSDVPQAGDKIIQLGNRTDPARQNAILMSAYGENAPLKQMLAGINDYSLADKVVLEEGFNQETHEPFTKNYGMSYTGARDRSSFIEFIPGTGLVVHCVVDGKVVLELNPDKKQYSFAGNITAESGDFGTFKIEGNKGVDENGDYDNRRITFAGPKTDGILASMENIDIPLAFPYPYLSTSGGKRNVGMYLKSEIEDSEDIWMNKTLVTYGNTEVEGLLIQYGGRFKCGLDLETRQFVRKFSASNEIQELIKSRYIMYINTNIHNTYILHCNGYSNCKILLPEYKNFDLTDYVRNGGNLMCEFKFIAHPNNSQSITIQSNPGGTITYENRPTMYNKGTAISSIQLSPGGCVSIAISLFRDNEGDRGESPYYRAIVTNVY